MRDLAAYIAEFLSKDAAHWPLRHARGIDKTTVRVAFRWFGSRPPLNAETLLRHLADLLATPHRSTDESGVVSILYTDRAEQADAEMVFAEALRDGAPGFAYEIHFPTGDGPFPGWFRSPVE